MQRNGNGQRAKENMRIWCPHRQMEREDHSGTAPGSGQMRSGNYTMLTPQVQIPLLTELDGNPKCTTSQSISEASAFFHSFPGVV